MAKGWTVWSEAEARTELALWKRSGQSLLKFSMGRGYSDSRLRWWRKRLGDVAPAAPTALVPVRIVEATPLPETPVEVVLASGEVLRVRRGFDADTLAAVARALEASC